MFYLIYLLSSLIFLCNYAYSNEDVNKITWICGNDKCDVAISDIVTISSLKAIDHKNKLTFVAGEKGRIFRKPLDGSDYWYAEINGKQGYVHKDFVRESSMNVPKPAYKFEEDNPFVHHVYSNKKDGTISPSPPTVIDGTTLNAHFSEFESNTSLSSPINDVTPPLKSNNQNENFKNSTESTQTDSVDTDASVKSDESDGSINIDVNNSSLGEDSTKDSPKLDGQTGFIEQPDANINRTHYDASGSDSVSSNAGNEGNGTIEPVDDEEEEEEDEEYDETDEITEDSESVPSPSSTNNDLRDQVNSNVNNETVVTNSVNGNPDQSEQVIDNVENSAKLVNDDSLNEQKPVPSEEVIPDNNEAVLLVEQGEAGNITTDSTEKSTVSPDFYSHPQGPSKRPTAIHDSQLTSEVSSVEEQQGVETNLTSLPNNLSQEPNASLKQKIDDEMQKSTAEEPTPNPYNSANFLRNAGNDRSSYPKNIVSNLDDSPVSSSDTSFNVKQSSHDSKVDSHLDSSISSTEAYGHISKDSTFSDSKNVAPDNSENNAIPDNTNDSSQLTPSVSNLQVDLVKEISDTHTKEEGTGKVAFVDKEVQNDTTTEIVRPMDESRYQQSITKEFPETVSGNKHDIDGKFSSHSYNTLSKEEFDQVPPNIEEFTTQSTPVYEYQSDSYPYTTLSPELHDPISVKDNVQKSYDTSDVPLMTETISEEDSSNFYSSVSSFFGYFKDLFRKSELPSEPKDSSTVEDIKQTEINSKPPSAPLGYCYEGESCAGLERPIGGEDQPESFYKNYKNNQKTLKKTIIKKTTKAPK